MSLKDLKLTERDSEILVSIYKHRFLTISQLQRLHFPSMQTAYRRLRLIKEVTLVSSFNVANINESIFAIARNGLEKVAAALGVEISELRWADIKSKPRDYYFMRHFLAINDFRILLRHACELQRVKLLGFIPDYYGKRTETGGIAKYIRDVVSDITPEREQVSHTPDGVFALERNGKAALFFLEIDRGTEVVSDPLKGTLKALRFYATYLMEGKYQRYAGDFKTDTFKGFRTLFVTTTDERIQNIRKAAVSLEVSAKTKRFLWLSTFDRLNAVGLFNPIWVSSDISDSHSYRIG